jgi:hypothetical protein
MTGRIKYLHSRLEAVMTQLRPATLLCLSLLIGAHLAADTTTKSTFHFGNVRFEPVDVLAYHDPRTIVAFATFKMDRSALAAAIDPLQSLLEQSGESGNFVVVRRLSPDRCDVSAFLTEARQIGFGSSPGKTVPSTAGGVAGECFTTKPGKMFDDEYDFRLSYDVPITPIPTPTTLLAGGGEPGSQYVALLKAIQAADWNAAHLHVREGELPKTKKEASESNYFESLVMNYPTAATVVSGLMKGDKAQLEIGGTSHDGRKIKGIVALKKVGNDWRVVDQSFYGVE